MSSVIAFELDGCESLAELIGPPSENDAFNTDRLNGKIRRFYMSPKTIQNAMSEAVKKAKIVKHATVHTLRQNFATHLLINGVNIREVQELLGHSHVETTMIYTHVMRDISNAPQSPLDRLYAVPNEK